MRDPRDLVAFVELDFGAFERPVSWEPRTSPAEGIRLGDSLREQVARVRPDWPGARARRADAAAHLRVIEALELASSRRR
ncbi:MAG TPA: hypothetical protein VHB21_28145 [Minicystis sp.]|nr:hypothetical protein [Minicystis sp.]